MLLRFFREGQHVICRSTHAVSAPSVITARAHGSWFRPYFVRASATHTHCRSTHAV